MTITKTNSKYTWSNATYLNKWIDSNTNKIIKWIFKINKNIHHKGGLFFGLYNNKNNEYR